MRITLIGQSTLLITLDEGIRLLTDPWFNSFRFLRSVPIALKPEEIAHCDLMLVSHNHIDHLDNAGLELAKRCGALFIGSVRATKRALRAGIKKVVSMKRHDVYSYGDIIIHAVSTEHPFASDAIGFLVKGKRTLYFSGDTRFTTSILQDLKGVRINVAMLQIACSWYPFVGYDGLNFDSASKLADALNPDIVIPIHYHVRTKSVEPEKFSKYLSNRRVIVLKPGIVTEV